MSGRKEVTVTITQNRLRELEQQARSASDLRTQNQILTQLRDAASASLARSQQRIDTMQRSLNGMTSRMNSLQKEHQKETRQLHTELDRVVRESNERIQRQAKETSRRLDSLRTEFDRELSGAVQSVTATIEENNRRTENTIRENTRAIMEDIERREQRTSERIRSVEQQVRSIQEDQASFLDMAREYASVAAELMENVREFPHGLNMTGGGKKERAALEQAGKDIAMAEEKPGFSAVACGNARTAFADALSLRDRAAAEEQAWIARLQSALEASDAARAQIDAASLLHIPAEDAAGVRQDFEIPADYWTNGTLSALRTRLDAVRAELEHPKDTTSPEDLDGLNAAARQIAAEASDAARFAAVAFFESQNRADTAEDFAEMLDSAAIRVVDDGFEGNDQRGAHRLHGIDRVSGYEIYIVQRPEVGEDGSLTTRIETDIQCGGELNEERFSAHRDAILETLGLGKDDGHVCGAASTVPGYETAPSDRAMLSAEEWAAARPAGIRIPTPGPRQTASGS